jgi:hypothetical protein
MTKVYSWIDFFKLKRTIWSCFTERYINDSIYDGVEDLNFFFEYKGKIIYAFPFEKNPSSGKVEYYDDEGKTLKTSFLKLLLNSVELPQDLRCNVFIPCSTGGKHTKELIMQHLGTPITTTASGVEKTDTRLEMEIR